MKESREGRAEMRIHLIEVITIGIGDLVQW